MSLADLPEPVRRRAAGVWKFRAQAEAIAAGRFQQIARDLRTTGAPQIVIELSEQAAKEEARHLDLCVELIKELGGNVAPPTIPHLEVEPHLACQERGLLLQVVATCCINETISAAILGEMLRLARPGRVHDTVQEILRDEINHGRIGWALLAHEAAQGPLEDVSSNITWMLDAAITDELLSGQAVEDPDTESADLGTLPRASRFRLFHDALNDLVFPGFEAFSISLEQPKTWLAQFVERGS